MADEYNPTPRFIVNFLLLMGYLGVLAAWCVNWYKFRSHPGIGLHKYLGATLVAQLLIQLVLTIYFGVYMGGNINDDLRFGFALVSVLISAIASGIFFSVLILIAKGCSIMGDQLGASYKACLAGTAHSYAYSTINILTHSL